MAPELSIIIPIYNVEPYISRCLDSILAQTFIDFEAILIDDGSPDQCGEIIDEYAEKDSRFIPIHQKNQGVSVARNAGLAIARGKYIGFVDPDDWIDPYMYEKLIRIMEDNDCDIVSCSWFDNYSNGMEVPFLSGLQTQFMDGETYMQHLFDMPPTVFGSVCSKLFRREKIRQVFNTHYTICEDNLFVAQYCVGVQKAFYLGNPLYHVYQRENSATRGIPGRAAYGLAARREIIDGAWTVSEKCGMLAERVFLDQCITYYNAGRKNNSQYSAIAKGEFITYIKNHKKAIIKNKSITIKQKIYLYLQCLQMWITG